MDGDTVLYGGATELKATLEYDFNREKEFCYKGLTMDEIIKHLALFVARLWQIHIFAEYAWYFRNALVRANYNNLKKGVHETTKYLELFLRNMLLDECNELHNREMHVSGVFEK